MASEKEREAVLHLGRETGTPSSSSSSSLSPSRPTPPASTAGGRGGGFAPPPPLSAPPTPGQIPGVAGGHPVTPYWVPASAAPGFLPPLNGTAAGGPLPPAPKKKLVMDAYILGFPLGFLGAHHFYLGRPSVGVLYLLSFGLFGLGWFIDLLRMPCLVSQVNKANAEKHAQQVHIRQQMAQQQQAAQHPQHQHMAGHPLNVVYVPFEPRSLADAYILWFPCGLFGFHHFYLRNYGMGFLYLLTFGLLGIGWLVDAFRMPGMVRRANSGEEVTRGGRYSQCTAHILALSPAGILGGHHYYLDRPVWGLLYTFTFGLLGVGWVTDWWRTSCLVKRASSSRAGMTSPCRKYVDEAYTLCIPLGFLGLHHFYLKRPYWGMLYFFTLGLMGIGWFVDWFRLPCLVSDCNKLTDVSCSRVIVAPAATATTTITNSTSFSSPSTPFNHHQQQQYQHQHQFSGAVMANNGNSSGGGMVTTYGSNLGPGQGYIPGQGQVAMPPHQSPFVGGGGGASVYLPASAPASAAAAGYGYNQGGYQAGYPGGPAGGGGGVEYPPEYSLHQNSTDGPHVHVSGVAPPSYEASLDDETRRK